MLRIFQTITMAILLCVTVVSYAFARDQFTTIPTARMYESGYLGFKVEMLDPFLKIGVGAQLFDPLYVEIQQNVQASNFTDLEPDNLFPGVNLKLRLRPETYSKPAITIGLNNAIGKSRLASEYIVASKYFHPFDLSGGVAWGKLGSAAHVSNPLKKISPHFGQERRIRDEDGNGPDNWFTGPDIGFFGGVSYQTPWKPLQFNVDWSADRYSIEQGLVNDFNTPNPWSVGATLHAVDKYSFHGAIVGGEKLMFRLTSHQNMSDMETRQWVKSVPARMQKSDKSAFTAQHLGLTGQEYHLPERQIYASDMMTSPAEMWHSLETTDAQTSSYLKTNSFLKLKPLRLRFEETFDLTSESDGVRLRSAAILDAKAETALGILASLGLRTNLQDNVSRVITQSKSLPAVRRNEHIFTRKIFALDRAYLAKNHSFGDIHTNVTAGYLEEMVAGWGGQVLYRPYQRTYAFGVEAWNTYQRDPYSKGNTKFYRDQHDWTGHLNGYYELPNKNTTLYTKVGRFLAGDYGATTGVSHMFNNGVRLATQVTVTNGDNIDLLGGVEHVHAGLNVSVPLKIKHIPKKLQKTCCDLDLRFEPLAQDSGQIMRTPMPLYEISEPLSYRHLAQHWSDIRE
jgi:hypothetical protein